MRIQKFQQLGPFSGRSTWQNFTVFFCALLLSLSANAVTFVANSQTKGSGQTATVTVPGTVLADDLLVVQVATNDVRSGSRAVTASSGWTQIGGQMSAGNLYLNTFYKRATSTDSGQSYSWNLSANRSYIAVLQAYRGVHTVNPIDAYSSATGHSNSNITAPAVTTSADDGLIIGVFAAQKNGTSFSPPAGMTEIFDDKQNASGGNGVAAMVAYVTQVPAGSSGAKTAQASNLNSRDTGAIGHLIALKNAGSTVPTLVAEWRLDENNWNGTSGELQDFSGNRLNGYAVSVSGLPISQSNNPALSGNPGTCSYAQFSGANSGYFRINDPGNNSVLDLSSALTVSSWIYPRSYPGGDLMSIVSKDENFEYHLRPDGRVNWWWGGGSNEMNSSSAVPLNRWSHIAIVYQSGSQQIYINGALAGTHNASGSLTTQNDPVLIGTDLGFNSRSFDGYIDEVRIYNGAMNQTQVQSLYTETHACINTGPDHYAVSHAGTGVTCEQSNVTITPHDASHNAMANDDTTISLSTQLNNDGWTLVRGSGRLTGNQYTFGGGETSVELGLVKLSPATLDIDVNDGSVTDLDGDVGEDPDIAFTDVGFKFYGNTVVDNIATQLAGKNSNLAPDAQTLSLRAIQTNSDTGRCDALVDGGAVDIGFAYECNDPTSCVLNAGVSISGTAINGVNNGGARVYQNVTLLFDSTGTADFVFNYPDAGRITLYASAVLDVGATAAVVSGSSNPFVVKPAGYCLKPQAVSGECAASGVGCAVFQYAGEPFMMQLSAHTWGGSGEVNTDYCDNTLTQNFQLSGIALGNALDPSLSGSAAGLGVANTEIASGGEVVFAQTVDNVGNFIFSAGGTTDYLGTGPIAVSNSSLVGRFVPYQFAIAARPIALPNDGFAYSGQPFTVKFDIDAQTKNDQLVTNYQGALAVLTADDLDYGIRNNSLTPISSLNTRVMTQPEPPTWSGVWTNGSISQDQELIISRNGLEAPFENLQVGVAVAESYTEGGLSIITANLDLDTTLDGSDDRVLLDNLNQRVARLFVGDSWGPENTSLNVPLRVEYWDGNQWLSPVGDGTSIDRTAIVFTSSSGAASAITSDPVTAPVGSNPAVSFLNDPTGSAQLILGNATSSANGDALMRVGAPGVTGYFAMDIDLTNYPWLRFDWNADGDYDNDLQVPTATIRFETYRGHDRVIYWQEVLD